MRFTYALIVAAFLVPVNALAASPWSTPTYADSTSADRVDGDDPVARYAAVNALGAYNGSIVVVDTNSGRVLAMVNQPLALKPGFMPCSTVKIPIALAALSEGIATRTTKIRAAGNLDMTEAMLHDWGFRLSYPERTGSLVIPAPQRASITRHAVEPDASAASYFFAAAAITGGRVAVPGLGPSSLQGDVRFVDARGAAGDDQPRRRRRAGRRVEPRARGRRAAGPGGSIALS